MFSAAANTSRSNRSCKSLPRATATPCRVTTEGSKLIFMLQLVPGVVTSSQHPLISLVVAFKKRIAHPNDPEGILSHGLYFVHFGAANSLVICGISCFSHLASAWQLLVCFVHDGCWRSHAYCVVARQACLMSAMWGTDPELVFAQPRSHGRNWAAHCSEHRNSLPSQLL